MEDNNWMLEELEICKRLSALEPQWRRDSWKPATINETVRKERERLEALSISYADPTTPGFEF